MRYLIALMFITLSTYTLAGVEQEVDAYFEKIDSEIVYGPNSVDIKGVVTFEIEYGQAFLNENHLSEIFRIMGQQPEENIVGWIIPGKPGDEEDVDEADNSWSVVKVEIADIGYISADGDEDWEYDRIIESITNDQSKRGNTVSGWVETPNYKSLKRTLNWSFELKNAKGEQIDVYQSLVLGRSGVMGFSTITPSTNRSSMLVMTHRLLDTASFTLGNRYEDYQPGVDKESALSLAALVGGTAVAKKLGLFALIIAFFVKFGKFIALGVGGVAILLGLRKRNKNKIK